MFILVKIVISNIGPEIMNVVNIIRIMINKAKIYKE